MLKTRYAYNEIKGFLFQSFYILDDILTDKFRRDVLRCSLSADLLLREFQQFLGNIDAGILDFYSFHLSEMCEQSAAAASEFQNFDRLLIVLGNLVQENVCICSMFVPGVIVLFSFLIIEASQ